MDMFGGMGKNFYGLRVCFFIDWKVASKKCLRTGPGPSISHYDFTIFLKINNVLAKNFARVN